MNNRCIYPLRHMVSLVLLGASIAIGGCAKMPAQSVSYHQPEAVITVDIIQTFACMPDDGVVVPAVSIQSSTAYVASSKVVRFNLDNFGGAFKKPTFSIDRTSDGRLIGINADNQGQAGEIIKGVLSIAAALALDGSGAKAAAASISCAQLKALVKNPKSGEPVVVTITYSAPVTIYDGGRVDRAFGAPDSAFDSKAGRLYLAPEASSEAVATGLGNLLGRFRIEDTAVFATDEADGATAGMLQDCTTATVANHVLSIPLRTVTDAVLSVTYIGPDNKEKSTWSGRVTVPTDHCYAVQVPTGGAFGTNSMELKLGNAGNIERLKYGVTTSGTSDLVTSLAAVAAARPTDSSRAKAAQDKIDLIEAQEKLAVCQADRTKCVK